ncbi:LytR/AlgR family response regulator transcription factor [Acetobacterium woodii]|uniref:Stage 0 sporulation protein A homolog n=1 Tax=Acetobacterium woodii (strain ATCC 29683 / DSM 1030 / JCM 2381 / KCTC 1655 / WB1) TaxID=931626 RepID=H6LEY9_ACEWD|nr:LytTR family DNA-binding domain-containing protein [Acetobacterium woodii]AFA46895.1 two component transcriptional regulator [Acetobacterium woodii DSM 1030]
MVWIGVCEDEKEQQEIIGAYIKKYAAVNCCDFNLSFFCSADEFWEHYQIGTFDIIFLDIYLAAANGIEIAKKLRNLGEKCAIVFTTSSRDYAIEGFELKAQHYLIKPITEEKIFEALARCQELYGDDLKYIRITNGKLEVDIYLKDIIYIEVFNKVSIIHTVRDEIKTYIPLAQLEQQLGGSPFLRCHRCNIINMNFVKDYTSSDFIMKNGDVVAIPRSKSVAVRQKYLNFIFTKVRGEDDVKH